MLVNHLEVLENSNSHSVFQSDKHCISNNVPGDSCAAGPHFTQQGIANQIHEG